MPPKRIAALVLAALATVSAVWAQQPVTVTVAAEVIQDGKRTPLMAPVVATFQVPIAKPATPPAPRPTPQVAKAPPIKSIYAPHLKRSVKLGRQHPAPGTPKLDFAKYLKAGVLPSPPASVDYSAAAMVPLSDIYGNDNLGCCVIAAGYHYLGEITGNANGTPFHATSAQIIADYSAIGGYVPGVSSTDQGCNIQTALNYWQTHGFADGSKIVAWMAVDPSNKTEIQQALYLFEDLVFGMDLPDAWVDNMPQNSGFTWGVNGNPDVFNGHGFLGLGYTATGVKIDTWGLLGTITYDAIAKYGAASADGELYVAVSEAMLSKATAKAPNGLDWSALATDANAMGANLPTPTPVVVTPPTPVPTPLPTPAPAPLPVMTIDAISNATVAADGTTTTQIIAVDWARKVIAYPPGFTVNPESAEVKALRAKLGQPTPKAEPKPAAPATPAKKAA